MKHILLIASVMLFVSCNSPAGKTDHGNADSDQSQETPIDKPAAVTPAVKVSKEQLPASIKFKGNLYEAWQWTDKLGENFLITTYVAPYPDKGKEYIGDDPYTAELHAFHFLKKDTSFKLLWKVSDAERSCPFDILCNFLSGATTITDLDSNGIAETTILYALVCRSDVSPAYKKLIMHEDTVKYSLRGLMCDPGSNPGKTNCVTEKDVNLENQPKAKEEWQEYTRRFGRYETEKDFAKAPAVFLEHARRQWMKYAKESFD